MRFVASRCRMSKRFSKEAGSGANPEIPTPRRDKLLPVNSLQGATPSGCSENTMHLEWIRDSSIPHATVPPKTACLLFLMVCKLGGQRHGRSVHNSFHRD